MGMFRRRPAQQVRIHLAASGREITIEGALLPAQRRGTYRIADAVLFEAATKSHHVGTVVIPADNVLFWQEVASLSGRDLTEIVERVA